MTYRLTISILLVSFGALAQGNVAIINDSDGFTNVRESKAPNSAVIGQIKNEEFFTFEKSNEDWWEINKRFDENGSVSDLKGFVHKSRIQPIDKLPGNDKRALIKKIFEKERDLIKAEKWDERKKHHEPKFDMVLNAAADHIVNTKDSELVKIFIEIIKLDTGSADEAPLWTFGFIFIKQPDWTIEQIKLIGPNQDLIDRLEFGLENSITESDNYAELKEKIQQLK